MKEAKAVVILLAVVVFISIAAGYGAGFFVYKDYKQKTAHLDKQAQLTLDKFGELGNNLKKLHSGFENSMEDRRVEREKLLSMIESINEDINEWKEGYKATISEIKGTMDDMKVGKLTRMVENLQGDVDEFEMAVQDLNLKLDAANEKVITTGQQDNSIDLGKISVRKKTAK